jgi:PAS domain-containing protein
MSEELAGGLDWSASGGEDLLKAMLDAADVLAGVIEILDDDYRYLIANRNAEAFYGRPGRGLAGFSARELGLSDGQIAAGLELLRDCVASGAVRRLEYPFKAPGQAPGWYLGTFSALPGLPSRVSFVVIDITARKKAQTDAETQTARLTLAVDAANLGIWEFEVAKDQIIWDARMRKLFGVAPDLQIDFATYARQVHPTRAPWPARTAAATWSTTGLSTATTACAGSAARRRCSSTPPAGPCGSSAPARTSPSRCSPPSASRCCWPS